MSIYTCAAILDTARADGKMTFTCQVNGDKLQFVMFSLHTLESRPLYRLYLFIINPFLRGLQLVSFNLKEVQTQVYLDPFVRKDFT